MRRLFQILLAASVFLASAACQRGTDTPKEKMIYKFTGSIENSADTKTHLGEATGESYPVYWDNYDKISVNGAEFTATPDESDPKRATFTGETKESELYTAIYPYSIYLGESFVLPAEYNEYQTGAFRYIPMWAKTDGTELAFKNIFAVLEVFVSNAEAVEKVEINSTEADLNGTFEVAYDASGKFYAQIESGGSKTTTLNCSGASAGNFYIPIPQGEYGQGTFSVTVTDANGESITRTNSNSITFGAGGIFSIRINFPQPEPKAWIPIEGNVNPANIL